VTPTLAKPARAGKRCSVFAVRGAHGELVEERRVNHEPGAIQAFLARFPEGTPVALESVGNGHTPATSGLALDCG
jgi:phage gp37-like protein